MRANYPDAIFIDDAWYEIAYDELGNFLCIFYLDTDGSIVIPKFV